MLPGFYMIIPRVIHDYQLTDISLWMKSLFSSPPTHISLTVILCGYYQILLAAAKMENSFLSMPTWFSVGCMVDCGILMQLGKGRCYC